MTTTAPGYVHVSARTAHHRPARQGAVRGFGVYIGMDEAAAAGTTLTGLATELRHHVQSVAPGCASAAALAIAPAHSPGTDLDVVRQVLTDPTAPPGAAPPGAGPAPACPRRPRCPPAGPGS
jgi:hypothetical protein